MSTEQAQCVHCHRLIRLSLRLGWIHHATDEAQCDVQAEPSW